MEARCPRCSIELRTTALSWIVSCTRCGGVFATRVVGPLGRNVADAAVAASDGAAMRASTAARISCPICQRMMEREPFRGIEVDRCGEHGIWFDRDEVIHALKGSRPRTLVGLGPGPGSMKANPPAGAAAPSTMPATPVDLADVGLKKAGAETPPPPQPDAADAAAWLVVDMVAGLFEN
jgi:Zn-finger nucleic acid-binding protein